MSGGSSTPTARLVALAALGLACGACNDRSHAATTTSSDAIAVARPGGSDSGVTEPSSRPDAGGPAEELSLLPPSASEELSLRMRHLVEALTQDNPDLAGDVLFPRDAYVLVRDSADPQAAWDKKVSVPFRKAVARTHKHTRGIARARFVSFELGHSVQQLSPKKKDWKRPMWRVKGSRLSFSVDGKVHTLRIAEMTAWRGAWYVTKLR